MCAQYCISYADVEKAHINIRDYIHLTPVLTSSILNQVAGRNLFFKCEVFQKTGSFKIRGALNAIRGLIPATLEGKPKAVVTHSSGNHGQALTYAAKLEGIPAYIVVPQTAPNCKKLAIQAYGASIVYSEQSDESREKVTKRILEETEGIMVHPNQEPAVIAGQGTIALEVLNQVKQPSYVFPFYSWRCLAVDSTIDIQNCLLIGLLILCFYKRFPWWMLWWFL